MRRVLNAEWLRAQVMRRGLSQAEFSQLAGISPTTMSKACTGGTVDPTTVRKITAALARTPVLEGAEDLVAVKST